MEDRSLSLLGNEGDLPRKVMTLFMLIDTSGSMIADGNIDKVNRAVENTIQQLRDVSDNNFDAEIRIAIMSFSDTAQWETKDGYGNPVALPMNEVVWNDLTAEGLTSMGQAFTELESKLSRSALLNSTTGAYAPVIFLLSDGQPTDDITNGLERLKHNNWYKVAMKIAIAVDDQANAVLSQFTGNPELVIRYDKNKLDLEQLVANAAVISSKMQSRSRPASDLGAAAESGMEVDSEVADQNAIEAVKKAQEESSAPNINMQDGW